MDKSKITVFLTYHTDMDALKDSIANIRHFLPDSHIIIHSSGGDISELHTDFVHSTEQSIRKEQYDSMVPMHIYMTDHMKKLGIKSEYVLLLSSNQLIIRHDFYSFMKNWKSGFFKRHNAVTNVFGQSDFTHFKTAIKDLDLNKFQYQSNHDGMFFLYEDWIDLMERCEPYRGNNTKPHQEEWLYIGYIFNKYEEDQLAEFGTYNHFLWDARVNLEQYHQALEAGKFLIKRVERNINDTVRAKIRTDNGYSY